MHDMTILSLKLKYSYTHTLFPVATVTYINTRNQPIKGWTAATRCGVTRKQEQEDNIMKVIWERRLQRTKK